MIFQFECYLPSCSEIIIESMLSKTIHFEHLEAIYNQNRVNWSSNTLSQKDVSDCSFGYNISILCFYLKCLRHHKQSMNLKPSLNRKRKKSDQNALGKIVIFRKTYSSLNNCATFTSHFSLIAVALLYIYISFRLHYFKLQSHSGYTHSQRFSACSLKLASSITGTSINCVQTV